MPSVLPLPPDEARRLVQKHGFSEAAETSESRWVLEPPDPNGAPLIIPRYGESVPVRLANEIAQLVGHVEYVEAVRKFIEDYEPPAA